MDVTACSTLFAWLNRELWLVTATDGQRRGGLIATFVSEASIVTDLPRLVVGLARQHHTWELVQASQAFALHLLGEDNLDLVWRFGLQSGRALDKFAGLTVTTQETGCPLLEDAIGWLECRVETSLDSGDRTVHLAEVLQGRVTNFSPPLTTRRLMELAPPDKLAEMKRLRHLDSYRDEEAIRAWRQSAASVQKDTRT